MGWMRWDQNSGKGFQKTPPSTLTGKNPSCPSMLLFTKKLWCTNFHSSPFCCFSEFTGIHIPKVKDTYFLIVQHMDCSRTLSFVSQINLGALKILHTHKSLINCLGCLGNYILATLWVFGLFGESNMILILGMLTKVSYWQNWAVKLV